MDIKRLIRDCHAIKRKLDSFTEMHKQHLEKIQKYFDSNKISELSVESETEHDSMLLAKKFERVTVDYDVNALKERISPDIFNEVVSKKYYINDINGLITLLKKSGVSPKEFKSFISVESSADRAVIRRLYDAGDIKKEELRGCYSAKVVKTIKISPVKDG